MIKIDFLTNKTLSLQFYYDPELIEKVKSIPGRKWDAENKRWTIPIDSLKPATEILDGYFDLSEKVIDLLEIQERQKKEESEKTNKLISSINLDEPLPDGKVLFKHQKEAIIDLIKLKRIILAHDMGLGKTLISLIAAKVLLDKKEAEKIIVVCPVSLKTNWQREAEPLNLELEIYSWAKIPTEIENNFILICDESHLAQGGTKTQRGKNFLALSKNDNCIACYLLSGTPMKNGRPINLFPLLKAVKHPITKDQTFYHRRYCDAKATRFSQWDVSGAIHLDDLFLKTKDIILRKTKKECLDLPDKLRVIREVDASKASVDEYNKKLSELKKKFEERIASGEVSGESEALVALGMIRQSSSLAKIETAVELTQELLEEGSQVVLFTEFLETAHRLKDLFGLEAVLLTGETEQSERQLAVDLFQTERAKVFVGTIKAGGLGLTLTAGSTVILIDRPYTPGDAVQAEDRLHRIGQKNSVTSIWLQYGDTDKWIDDLLQSKTENINVVLSGVKKKMKFNSINEIAKYTLRKMLQQSE